MMQLTYFPLAAGPGWTSNRRPALGWGISLLVHALAVIWLWHLAPPRPENSGTRPVKRIEVWLVPGAPPVAVAPFQPALAHAARTPGPGPRQPHSSAGPVAPVVVQAPSLDAAPPALASQNDAAKVAGATPAFDLFAARASARALAREPEAAHPLRQADKDTNTSERIQERFERARRGDCLKANDSVNLLANVVSLATNMVANAVDSSGCKW